MKLRRSVLVALLSSGLALVPGANALGTAPGTVDHSFVMRARDTGCGWLLAGQCDAQNRGRTVLGVWLSSSQGDAFCDLRAKACGNLEPLLQD